MDTLQEFLHHKTKLISIEKDFGFPFPECLSLANRLISFYFPSSIEKKLMLHFTLLAFYSFLQMFRNWVQIVQCKEITPKFSDATDGSSIAGALLFFWAVILFAQCIPTDFCVFGLAVCVKPWWKSCLWVGSACISSCLFHPFYLRRTFFPRSIDFLRMSSETFDPFVLTGVIPNLMVYRWCFMV